MPADAGPGATGPAGELAGHADEEPRGLLAIFAHPDDETFGAGGTMALVAASGHPVWLICATNGDEGGRPHEEGDHAMDPEIRRAELRCACQALGIAEPIFLGYRDSGMETWTPGPGAFALADRGEVVSRLVGEIRRLRPAVIVTFDPGGIYGHPDHVTVSEVATAAFEQARAEPGGPRALYHQALPKSWASEMVKRWSEGDATPDARPPSPDDLLQRRRFVELARPDEDITTRVDVRSVVDRKRAAFACHASQIRLDDLEGQGADDQDAQEAWAVELFIRVDPAPEPGTAETGLLGL